MLRLVAYPRLRLPGRVKCTLCLRYLMLDDSSYRFLGLQKTTEIEGITQVLLSVLCLSLSASASTSTVLFCPRIPPHAFEPPESHPPTRPPLPTSSPSSTAPSALSASECIWKLLHKTNA